MKKITIENVENFNCQVSLDEVIDLLTKMEARIMASLQDALAQLDTVVAQTQKIFAEVTLAKDATELKINELQAMVAQLQADLANNQAVDLQPLIDKINNEVLPALQVLDDINPDQAV